jgi:hypothetical protein
MKGPGEIQNWIENPSSENIQLLRRKDRVGVSLSGISSLGVTTLSIF